MNSLDPVDRPATVRSRWWRRAAWLAMVPLTAVTVAISGDQLPPAVRPGVLGHGVTLLPNGGKLAPAGRHVQVGDLPLAMVPSRDGRFVLVTTNGFQTPTI